MIFCPCCDNPLVVDVVPNPDAEDIAFLECTTCGHKDVVSSSDIPSDTIPDVDMDVSTPF